MPDWLKAVLPFAGPLVVAGLTALLGMLFAKPKRLRRDIAEDASILPSLSGVARGLLSEDMHHNALRLAAWRRHPGLRAWDYFRLSVIVAGVSAQAYYAWAFKHDQPSQLYLEHYFSIVYPVVLVAGAWLTFHQSWLWRSKDRNAMLERHHVPVDPDTALFWSDFGPLVSIAAGAAAIVVPPTITAFVLYDVLGGPDWLVGAIAFAAAGAFLLVSGLGAAQADKRPATRTQVREAEIEAYVSATRVHAQVKARRKDLGLRPFERLPKSDRAAVRSADPGQRIEWPSESPAAEDREAVAREDDSVS